MAKDDSKNVNNMKTLRDLSNSIQQLTDDIYTDTYYTPKSAGYDTDSIRDNINKSLDKIFQKNMNINGRPNISNLYTRLMNDRAEVSSKDMDAFTDVFEDQRLMNTVASSYASNTYIKQFDAEIDLICKYMPKIDEAIEVKKDMVLCADQFNRDFLTVRNRSSIDESDFFNSEVAIIKDKYDIADLLEISTYRAWKYGEDFLYIVPYKKAFDKIFNNREKNANANGGFVNESFHITEKDLSGDKDMKNNSFDFTVTFNSSFALSDSIRRITEAASTLENIAGSAINEPASITLSQDVVREAESNGLDLTVKTQRLAKNKVIPDNTVPEEDDDRKSKLSLSSDGIVNPKSVKKDKEQISKIPGCLVKRLEREKVIPIYIEDICMGYYYIEIENPTTANSEGLNLNTPTLSAITGSQQRAYGVTNNQEVTDPFRNDTAIKQMASKLAGMIDKKFINNNQDLYRELYMILKYDEKFNSGVENINVTFIPPDDIEHIYFKMNPKTHRGVSLLERALIPAKIFIAMSMSSVVGMLTRGQDKRVYYVRQQVETNISKTLLSAINQIKKGNFGVRNLENLMGVLNITGMYNDYFIPKSANGESPIDFEVLEGQKIDPNMELLEKFESYAIGTTSVPLELIDARLGVDFATQLTMTNAKHVRMVYKDQAKVQTFGGRIITKIYNAEFDKNAQLALFLPPPLYITLTNTAQLFTNVEDVGTKIIAPRVKDLGGSDEMVSAAVTEYIERTLGSYIDFNAIDDIIQHVMLNSAKDSGED